MARKSGVSLCALNITTHPHSPLQYYNIFLEAFKERGRAKIRGDQVGTIGTFNHINPEKHLDGIYGYIYKFTDITDAEWYNLKKDDNASVEDINAINIPDYLKPNFVKYHYAFYPNKHRFIFEALNSQRSISPNSMANILLDLLNSKTILEKFPECQVVIEQAKEGLYKILKVQVLTNLEILINRPNADVNNEEEEEVLRRLENQNTATLYTEYKAAKGQSIKPDKKTLGMARVAISNGYVKAKGKNIDGEVIPPESTLEHPQFCNYRIDSTKENYLEKFFVKSNDMLNAIQEKQNEDIETNV